LGCAALVLGVAGALVEPEIRGESGRAFVNRDFATALGAVAALAAAMFLSRRMREGDAAKAASPLIAVGSFLLLNLVLLVAVGREILRFFDVEQPTALAWGQTHALADFCFSAWLMVQSIANLVTGFWRRVALARWIGLILLAATLVKLFAYDMRELGQGYRVISYLALGALLMGVSFAYQRDWLGLREVAAKDNEVHG
jgi:uncharacterized membrane protein